MQLAKIKDNLLSQITELIIQFFENYVYSINQFDTLRISYIKSFYAELSKITNGVCIEFSNRDKTSKLLEIASLTRGGEKSKQIFQEQMEKNTDKELDQVYSMYKTIIER